MSNGSGGVSRRRFLASGAVVGAIAPQLPPGSGPRPRPALAIDVLDLDPATQADLETFAAPVLREAAWLDELPLETVGFAFRFDPGDGR